MDPAAPGQPLGPAGRLNVRNPNRREAMTRSSLVPFVLALSAALPAGLAAQNGGTGSEEDAVRAAVDHYLAAHATGQGEHIDRVFHPDAMLFWVADGQLQRRSGAEYRAGFRGSPPPDEAQRKRWIEMVDVTGDVAVAKVVLDYPNARFTDYFALLKTDGEWRVMTKIFHRGPPTSDR